MQTSINTKEEAETITEKAKDYFEELKTKGGDALKEHFPEAEEMLNKLFKKAAAPDNAASQTEAKK